MIRGTGNGFTEIGALLTKFKEIYNDLDTTQRQRWFEYYYYQEDSPIVDDRPVEIQGSRPFAEFLKHEKAVKQKLVLMKTVVYENFKFYLDIDKKRNELNIFPAEGTTGIKKSEGYLSCFSQILKNFEPILKSTDKFLQTTKTFDFYQNDPKTFFETPRGPGYLLTSDGFSTEPYSHFTLNFGLLVNHYFSLYEARIHNIKSIDDIVQKEDTLKKQYAQIINKKEVTDYHETIGVKNSNQLSIHNLMYQITNRPIDMKAGLDGYIKKLEKDVKSIKENSIQYYSNKLVELMEIDLQLATCVLQGISDTIEINNRKVDGRIGNIYVGEYGLQTKRKFPDICDRLEPHFRGDHKYKVFGNYFTKNTHKQQYSNAVPMTVLLIELKDGHRSSIKDNKLVLIADKPKEVNDSRGSKYWPIIFEINKDTDFKVGLIEENSTTIYVENIASQRKTEFDLSYKISAVSSQKGDPGRETEHKLSHGILLSNKEESILLSFDYLTRDSGNVANKNDHIEKMYKLLKHIHKFVVKFYLADRVDRGYSKMTTQALKNVESTSETRPWETFKISKEEYEGKLMTLKTWMFSNYSGEREPNSHVFTSKPARTIHNENSKKNCMVCGHNELVKTETSNKFGVLACDKCQKVVQSGDVVHFKNRPRSRIYHPVLLPRLASFYYKCSMRKLTTFSEYMHTPQIGKFIVNITSYVAVLDNSKQIYEDAMTHSQLATISSASSDEEYGDYETLDIADMKMERPVNIELPVVSPKENIELVTPQNNWDLGMFSAKLLYFKSRLDVVASEEKLLLNELPIKLIGKVVTKNLKGVLSDNGQTSKYYEVIYEFTKTIKHKNGDEKKPYQTKFIFDNGDAKEKFIKTMAPYICDESKESIAEKVLQKTAKGKQQK